MKAEAKSQYEFAVLVIDEDISLLDVLKAHLEMNNMEVYTANNAERALHLTALHPHIKIIITALYMPDSCIDGKTLALILMDREPRTIVFAMTAHSDKFLLDDCLRTGFRDYFVKPVDLNMILKSIRSSCERIRRWEKII